MYESYKLTIAVITMNRSAQLVEALDSCLACTLPENTEFVVLDNASTDDTQAALMQYKKDHPEIQIYDHRSEENLGVGGGRSFVFSKARGEYVYFLDDDAVIAPECKDSFFAQSLSWLDAHPQAASMTTQIYDEIFGFGRTEIIGNTPKLDGMPTMFFYFGGSHFLRKEYFDIPLYLPIRYGSEEYLPSIKAIDKGFCHVYNADVNIIHKPKINKWVGGTEKKRQVLINGISVQYATKKLLYPVIIHPVLWLAHLRRTQLHLKSYPGAKKEVDTMVRQIIRENPCKRIRFTTVIKLFRSFGATVF